MPRANNNGTAANDDNLNVFTEESGIIRIRSYLCIGADKNLSKEYCDRMCKFFKSKFTRYLYSVAKSSQDVTTKTFQFVPIQDFTDKSNINWDKGIEEIDQQLYAKYGLNEEEIGFIESMIKTM